MMWSLCQCFNTAKYNDGKQRAGDAGIFKPFTHRSFIDVIKIKYDSIGDLFASKSRKTLSTNNG